MELTHFDEQGNAWMVDVSEKDHTHRIAVASNLIPLCHPLMLTKVEVHCHLIDGESPAFTTDTHNKAVKITATVKTMGQTGVEMEALTAVQVGLLTVYDMCKAIDKGMIMGPTYLVEKDGGKSGHFIRSRSK